MVEIVHYSSARIVNSVNKNGLSHTFRFSQYSGTDDINYVLMKYRPGHLPDWMDRSKCVFFDPGISYPRETINTGYRVEHSLLDPDKLFVFDYRPAQNIWQDTVDAAYSGETTGIPLEVSAKQYWDSAQTFADYLKNPKSDNVEVIYFGDVPPEHIIICSALPLATQSLFSYLTNRYEVLRIRSGVLKHIQYSNRVVYTIRWVDENHVKFSYEDKNTTFDSDFIRECEELFSFKTKVELVSPFSGNTELIYEL
jgi:hypothetical protein